MSASLVGSEMCIRDSPKLPMGCSLRCFAFADAKSADETGRPARRRRFSGRSGGAEPPPREDS
eukprot:10504411-Alexandrium_andersonii.AAC.1